MPWDEKHKSPRFRRQESFSKSLLRLPPPRPPPLPPPRFARPSPFSSPCVCWGNARRAHYGGGGDGRKGGIQSPFSTDERGNTPFFSLSRFLFSSSSSFLILLVLCIICFFLRPLSLPRILLVKRRVPHRRMKKYILIHLMQFLFALCFFVEDFEVSSSS